MEPGRVSANDLSHDDDGALSSGKDDQKCDDDNDDDYGALAQVMAKCSYNLYHEIYSLKHSQGQGQYPDVVEDGAQVISSMFIMSG